VRPVGLKAAPRGARRGGYRGGCGGGGGGIASRARSFGAGAVLTPIFCVLLGIAVHDLI
jgi:hypothetical protein